MLSECSPTPPLQAVNISTVRCLGYTQVKRKVKLVNLRCCEILFCLFLCVNELITGFRLGAGRLELEGKGEKMKSVTGPLSQAPCSEASTASKRPGFREPGDG